MVNAQEIEIRIVPDIKQQMLQNEFDYQEKQFNNAFTRIGKDTYFGYLMNTNPNQILKDACKWKGCKKPFLLSKQNELIEEFIFWLSENYFEWSKQNGN